MHNSTFSGGPMGDAVAEADYKEEGGNCDNSAPLNAFVS